MPKHYIGVDVGGTKIAYGLFDEQRKLLEKYKFPSETVASADQFTALMADQVAEICQTNGIDRADLDGVGICLPGFVDDERGISVRVPNLPILDNYNAREQLEAALGARVAVGNDANAAALAEYRYGAGRGARHMIYVAISTGIGCGIIINERLFTGSYGYAGEAGHMLVTPDSPEDYESHVSGGHIVKRIAERIRAGQKSVMEEMCGGDMDKINAFHLEDAYNLNDELAVWALDHMGEYFGTWLYNLYLAFNINRYVFGGGLVKMKGDMLFGRVRKKFDSLHFDGKQVDFKFAELGQDFGIVGAVELLFDK